MVRKATGRPKRRFPEGYVPLIDVEGTAFECGRMLGQAWRGTLEVFAQTIWADRRPWWTDRVNRKLIAKYAPHLPDVFCGMAKGAGLKENQIGSRIVPEEQTGCTSFAAHPGLTLDGLPISGQTKDAPDDRVFRYQVLRMKISDAPSALTLTYPGWIFGHGFVRGGCSIFRNSLYAGQSKGRLSYAAWGTLALHCRTAEAAVELALRNGLAAEGHCTVADEQGGIFGIEIGAGGIAVLKPRRGIYTHANHVASNARIRRHEVYEEEQRRISRHRQQRLYARLDSERSRLTAQLAYQALCDHEGYPDSLCRHCGEPYDTTGAVVAEPARRLLHVTRSAPCSNWPRTYSL